MNKHEVLIDAFESKLRKLMTAYDSLKQQNETLKKELAKEHEDLIQAHAELLEIRKKNDHLIMSSQFTGSNSEDRAAAKKQIDRMVREIDKCLALLND